MAHYRVQLASSVFFFFFYISSFLLGQHPQSISWAMIEDPPLNNEPYQGVQIVLVSVSVLFCFFVVVFPHTDESVLMDLKALLVEAKQKVPPVLQILQTGDETMLDIGGKLLELHRVEFRHVISIWFCFIQQSKYP